jgi:hypothetical protein
MKDAREIRTRLAVGTALALALGAVPSAQITGRGDLPRCGQELLQGSLENDLRRGPGMAPRLASLELTVRLVGAEIDPYALIPLAQDLGKVVTLSGGVPGCLAMIEVGLLSSSPATQALTLANKTVFTGTFDERGEFEIALPPALDLQSPGRMVSAVVSLDEAVDEAFATWEVLGSLPKPQAAGGAGSKHELRRPSQGAGHAGQAEIDRDLDPEVEEEDEGLPSPRGVSGGSKQELRRPSRRGGHVR